MIYLSIYLFLYKYMYVCIYLSDYLANRLSIYLVLAIYLSKTKQFCEISWKNGCAQHQNKAILRDFLKIRSSPKIHNSKTKKKWLKGCLNVL